MRGVIIIRIIIIIIIGSVVASCATVDCSLHDRGGPC
jgi:hypothetical protein